MMLRKIGVIINSFEQLIVLYVLFMSFLYRLDLFLIRPVKQALTGLIQKGSQRFPDLTLMGGISSYTLHLGTRDDVVAETEYAIEAAQEYGSILVGCSNYPVPGTPPENLEAMIETIDRHR